MSENKDKAFENKPVATKTNDEYNRDNLFAELRDKRHDLTEKELKAMLQAIDKKNGWDTRFETFLITRWWKAVLHLQSEADKQRDRYFFLSIVILIASAITTALSGVNLAEAAKILPINLTATTCLDEALIFGTDSCNVSIGTILRALIFLLSIIVTISVGLEQLYKFNEVYLKKRKYAEALKSEGIKFLQLVGNYYRFREETAPNDSTYPAYVVAYPTFAENVEKIIKEINDAYISLFARNLEPSPHDTEKISDNK